VNKQDRLNRLVPLTGALFVGLELGGVAAGSQPNVTLGDPTAKILAAITKHAGAGAWVGAHMELASLAAFAAFAAWLLRSRPRALHGTGLLAAGSFVAVTGASLLAGDAIRYGTSHGLAHQQLLALFYVQSALFSASWAASAVFLALVPVRGWLRRSALAIAALQLAALAAPTAGVSQLPTMLFLIWVLAASVSLAWRPHPAISPAPAAA